MDNIQIPDPLKENNISDGGELIPAEGEARKEREAGVQPSETLSEKDTQPEDSIRTADGYAVDNQGRLNNYPVTPPVYQQQQRRFGFTEYAERYNGRLAMMGFALLVVIELLTGQSFISLIS